VSLQRRLKSVEKALRVLMENRATGGGEPLSMEERATGFIAVLYRLPPGTLCRMHRDSAALLPPGHPCGEAGRLFEEQQAVADAASAPPPSFCPHESAWRRRDLWRQHHARQLFPCACRVVALALRVSNEQRKQEGLPPLPDTLGVLSMSANRFSLDLESGQGTGGAETKMPSSRTPSALLDSATSWPSWGKEALALLLQERATLKTKLLIDPAALFHQAGMMPDPWQERVLRSQAERIMILAARQVGKSVVCAALALRTMLLEAPALVLVVSPSDRQSGEFVRKVKSFYFSLRGPEVPHVVGNNALQLHLSNGSRLLGLPDSEGKIRGFSDVRLLFFEEASRVPDGLLHACTPMLAVSHGRQVALSTAFGKQGWYFDSWEKDQSWHKENVTADQCPRISRAFLEAEKQKMPERCFLQEYYNAFLEPFDSVFRQEDIDRLVDPNIKPLLNW
jgi:hypothetical protein